MNKSYLMGIDIGTSSVKVVLTDTHGVKLYSHCRPHEILQPRPRLCEQDAQNAWWVGAKEGIQACIQGSGVDAAHIAAFARAAWCRLFARWISRGCRYGLPYFIGITERSHRRSA